MTLPVSSYEEILACVRRVTTETIQLQREITSTLSDGVESASRNPLDVNKNVNIHKRNYATHPQRRTAMNEESIQNRSNGEEFGSFKDGRPTRPTSLFTKTKENEKDMELKEVDEKRTTPDELSSNDVLFHRSDWGPEGSGLWHSGPSSLSLGQSSNNRDFSDAASFTASLNSGTQSLNCFSSTSRRAHSHQQLGTKFEMVYNLLSMLGTSDREDMSKTLLAMSSSPESCLAMRQSGCLPLLIQLIHSPELDVEVRGRAAKALDNIVHAQNDSKRLRRETRVLKFLRQIREYCDDLKMVVTHRDPSVRDDPEKHPVEAIGALMKFSFDAEHRQAMCTLGGLHAIAELIQLDHEAHGGANEDPNCITLRRFAGMSLTNLTFGDGGNKALLCGFDKFMRALVAQLTSPSEDLRQVTASVLRNLSWRADSESKRTLREVGAVTALTVAAMEGEKEATLKSILSALWNLSAHCSMNKVDICSVPGALAFLVKMLRYNKPGANTAAIIENAGGILRNISSHIAVREDYRQILRDNNCFEILLEQLKSSSLTIVSNACGTLWNLSARCPEDQRRLWEMGATSMLRSLVQSKHKMISMGSSAALKNLLSANPTGNMFTHLDSTAKGLGLQSLPTLFVRKQRALEQELDITLSETCDNIEPNGSPTHSDKSRSKSEEKKGNVPKRSDSHESVTSTQSDSVYERVNQSIKNENKILESKSVTLHGSLSENQTGRKMEEQKLLRRYKSSMIPTLDFKKLNQEKKNERTKEENQVETETEVGAGAAEVAATSRMKESETETKNKKISENREGKRGIPVLKNRIKSKSNVHSSGSESGCNSPYSGSNFSSQYEEDRPVNYSLKYTESEEYGNKCDNKRMENCKRETKEEKKFEELRDYAETDLDQPTDFSLKYGEETSSDEDVKNQAFNYYDGNKTKESGYYAGQAESEDTTRTYCTEGTPYDGTPYNFSGSNSMSDLRIDPDERDNPNLSYPDVKGNEPKSLEQKQARYENGKKDYQQNRTKRLSREFESGISTPERPVQYHEEGTPGGCFSRVSSSSSLSCGKDQSSKTSPEKSDKKPETKETRKVVRNLNAEDSMQNKAVTFGATERYGNPDETPLMFSRCSSLNSLSSFEQINQSIPDDRSSVVSDFSRMTSGLVSPSELPDSPTQTVPPSPKRTKPPVNFSEKIEKKNVFEDNVVNYKQEDTPVEFSRATSLSSLNADNLKTPSTSSIISGDEGKRSREEKRNCVADKNESDDLKEQIVPEKTELERKKLELTTVTEEDEVLLPDCINIGIQENSRRSKDNREIPTRKNLQDCNKTKQGSGIPVKSQIRSKFTNENGNVYSGYEASDDAVHTYQTEGSPAVISHAGSLSDLSSLSVTSGGNVRSASGLEENSDDGSFCSGDADMMLAECIQSGMPKAKPQKEKNRNVNGAMGITLSKTPKSCVSENKNCESYPANQLRNECLRRKDHLFTAKDEISTFATENSPCNFSARSSFSDLTTNSVDSPLSLSRPEEASREESAHLVSPAHNTSHPSPSSISLIESEDGGKASEDRGQIFTSPRSVESCHSNGRDVSFSSAEDVRTVTAFSEDLVTAVSRNGSSSSLSVESYDSCEPTPLEQALLEECIHSGMPRKNRSKKSEKSYKYDEKGQSDSKNESVSSASAGRITAGADVKSQNETKSESEPLATNSSESLEIKIKDEFVMRSSIELKRDETMNGSFGGHTWSEDYTSPSSVASPSVSDRIDGLKIVGDGSDNSRKKDDVVLPNFKIGSEMTDQRFLQAEASKICREIRKYQDFEMAASMTSEVSFLDSNDFSLFDLSNEAVDFESSDAPGTNKNLTKMKNIRKPFLSVEPVSLPSLGSLKQEAIEAIDLESSIISVASITSEIAETYSKEKETSNRGTIDTATATLDKGDETLNEGTLGSDTEIFDDENSILSQDNLPLDSLSSKESTPKKLNRKLTPKEKRKTIRDRYRTYTVADLKAGFVPENTEIPEKTTKKITPKQRRINDRNRFLTRILGKDEICCGTRETEVGDERPEVEREELEVEADEDEESNSVDISSASSTTNSLTKKKTNIPKFRSSKLLKNSRKLDKDRYRTRTLSIDSKVVNDLLAVSPAERRELAQNAKLVAICLKTAAREGDSEIGFVSDSETENSFRTLPIDTATYSKLHRGHIDDGRSEDEYQSFESYAAVDLEEDVEKKGPRISKPGDKTEAKDEEAGKGIRGRRKQLYSSPLKKMAVHSTPQSPKASSNASSPQRYALSTTKSLPNVPKSVPKTPETPVLCREGTFTKEEATVLGKSLKNPRSIPVFTKKVETPNRSSTTTTTTNRPAIRNKSAPVLRNSKSVTENSRITRPVSSYAARNGDANLNHKRHNSAGSTSVSAYKTTGMSVSNLKRHSASGTSASASSSMKNSPSNQSIKSTGSLKSASSYKGKSSVSSPKSQSNISLDSLSSSEKAKSKTPKKEATSKIASLWKKVEESKKKDKNTKDNRVWITAEKEDKTNEEEILVIEKEEILELASGKIVRSSTFQGLGDGNPTKNPSAVEESRNKSLRSSGDFSSTKWETDKTSGYENRNVISAIVPPYNYSPPTSVKLTTNPIKQVESYHKGSMKVTTV